MSDQVVGRTLVVGDIHGCDTALEILLDKMEPQPTDRLVILGDVIDRGPGSCEAIDELLRAERTCELTFILGNHEEMMLDVLASGPPQMWLRHGGIATLDSYGGRVDRIPDAHLELLNRAVAYWESSSVICVHANLEPGVNLASQQPAWLRWQKLTGLEFPHPSGKLVVCGHTPQANGLPLIGDGWICLDTWAYTGRYLTGLDVDSGVVYQSRQSGEFRQFHINELKQ
jgi:serine/threonine protein phosphatase 1